MNYNLKIFLNVELISKYIVYVLNLKLLVIETLKNI